VAVEPHRAIVARAIGQDNRGRDTPLRECVQTGGRCERGRQNESTYHRNLLLMLSFVLRALTQEANQPAPLAEVPSFTPPGSAGILNRCRYTSTPAAGAATGSRRSCSAKPSRSVRRAAAPHSTSSFPCAR